MVYARIIPRNDAAGSSANSGLSGTADIPDPPRPHDGGFLRQSRQAIAGTVRGLPKVIALAWRASRPLTITLGLAAVGSGLVPTALAYLSRLLLNTVLHAYVIHSRQLADRLRIPIPVIRGFPVTGVEAIFILAALQFAVLWTGSLLSTASSISQQLLQEKTSLLVGTQIMRHSSSLDLSFFEDSRSYDAIRHAQREAASRPVTMISNSSSLVQGLVTFGSIVGLLVALSPWLALVTLIAPIPAFIADSRHGRRAFLVARLSSPLLRRMDYLASLVTTDTFAKEVRLFGLGGYFTERFGKLGEVHYRRQRDLISRRCLATFRWSSVSTLAQTASYIYVAYEVIMGSLSFGDLMLFSRASASLQSSIQSMFQSCTGMYEGNLYLDEFYKLMSATSTIEGPAGAVTRELARGQAQKHCATVGGSSGIPPHVVFENVSFSYPGASRRAVERVSFEIRPGETVAIVGRNGAGKSTLIKLLCRLYDPSAGRIIVDGADIRDLAPEELRSRITALFQDYVTYQATAAENIGLGDVALLPDRALIAGAAMRAGADSMVTRLPSGYDTPLGKWFSKGVELSGGEWQKIALARAFLRDRSLLILDEPTAALDAQAEHELFLRLAGLAANRTTLYISHRFSTVRQADRILLLTDGRIAEQGSHGELMSMDGEYASLFRLQASAYTDAGHCSPAGPNRGLEVLELAHG